MGNTSYISNISYEIEKWLYKGYDIDTVFKEVGYLKEYGEFPKNLELIDAFLDKSYGCVDVHF